MINVVAALIYKDDCVLIAKRATGDNDVINKWEFPGRKVEDGESEKHAIEREIKEEFDIEIKVNRYLVNNVHHYPSKTVNLKLYECKYISGEINLHDHFDYKWVNPKELLDYDLATADIPLARYVKKSHK